MKINDRIKLVRKHLGLTQKDFGEQIAVAQSYLTNIENEIRPVTDKIIKLVCLNFSVNEEWLRTGKGEMFIEQDTFSLDSYAKQKNLSGLEKKIVKAYMSLSPETRENLLETFKRVLQEENTLEEVAEEISPDSELKLSPEDEKELEQIKQEMLDEKRVQISSVSPNIKGKNTKDEIPS